MSSSGGNLAAFFLTVALLILAGCAPVRSYEAALVLADLGAGDAPSRLKQTTATPVRQAVAYRVAGRDHAADLYLPGAGAPAAGIVVAPGVVPKGKDDPRLTAFATTLARAQFAVLAPELPGFRQLVIQPSDARVVADAFAWLASRPDLAPEGRAGIGAFSYAVGPAVLAALEPDIRERVRFVVAVGGYHDLSRALCFLTTGGFEHAGQWHYLQPDEYGQLVFVRSALPYLPPSDRVLLEAMAQRRLQDRQAELTDLATGLSPDGAAVYALVANRDPARFAALKAALPERLRADLAALSLAGQDLSQLAAPLILIHGKTDNLIPYPESIALAGAAPPDQARLYLIEHLLGHVDLRPGPILTWAFWTRDLPDILRLGQAVYHLLGERADGRP